MTMLRAGAVVTGYEIREDFARRAQRNVADFLGEDERALILGGNAQAFLDLTTTPHREAAS